MNYLTVFRSWLISSIVVASGCVNGLATSELDVAASAHCPSGNGFYVLYYGSAPGDFMRIQAAKPNFVVLGDGLEARTDLPMMFQPATRVIAYLSTARGTANIDARIDTAMRSGFDGVFFDDVVVSAATSAYNAEVAQRVHDKGKMVIMNPGIASVDQSIFQWADIVSVENKWSSTLSPSGVDAWRWLAVQGDPGISLLQDDQAPTSGTEALARLDSFRNDHHGWWYYASEYDSVNHKPLATQLPSWFDSFATAVRDQRGAVSCTSTGSTTTSGTTTSSGTTTTTTVTDVGTGPYIIGIHTFNQADNSEFGGMWTTVQTAAGQTIYSGFSPIQYHLPAGNYLITTANYNGPTATYTFNHWDDHSTGQPRPVTLTTSPTGLWTGGWYAVQ
jgi:hypothetical protein